jgi:hypothetical protein
VTSIQRRHQCPFHIRCAPGVHASTAPMYVLFRILRERLQEENGTRKQQVTAAPA